MDKLKVIYQQNTQYLFLLLIIFYGIWKFYPAFQMGVTISLPYGDGLATIGWFGEISEQVKTYGVSYLLSDLTPVELLGNGVYDPVPVNSLQKTIVSLLAIVVSGDNIYDAFAMSGFILVGFATFFLLKEIGTLSFFAFIGALMMMNNDNFVRYYGHLQLAIPFIPILLTLFIIRAAKIVSLKNIIFVVLITVLNFMMNEYYGYYGVFFTIFLFLGLLFYYHPNEIKTKMFWMIFLKYIAISIVIFVGLMSIAYPNLIFQKIVAIFMYTDSIVGQSFGSRSYDEFIAFSIKNHWYYFYPKIEVLQNLLPSSFFTHDVFFEQSFRIGFILPTFFIISYGFIFLNRHKLPAENKKSLFYILALLPAILILFLFSNDPNHGISLVKVSYHLSEIFRVGARAYLYIFILSLVLFFFYFNLAWNILQEQVKNHSKAKNVILYLATFTLFVIALYDITGKLWRSQFDTFKLPTNEVYSFLETLPKGLVCEVPFYSLPEDVPEASYIYTYNRSVYKAPLLNAQVPTTNKYYLAYNSLSSLIKNPDIETVGLLRDIGVRYMVVDSNNSQWDDSYILKELTLLRQNNSKQLYQINNFKRVSQEETHKVLLDQVTVLQKKALVTKMKSAPYLKLSEIIDFKEPTSRPFIMSGFSSTENWGTWTDSKKAVIVFQANDKTIKDTKFLEISFQIFSDGKYAQQIQFKLNDKVIKNGIYFKAEKISISIPIAKQLKEQNVLVIEAPTAISPKELNIGADMRKLSVGMINIKFN